MALINCPRCGQQISDKAEQCPKCGYINVELSESAHSHKRSHKAWFIILALTIITIVAIAAILIYNHNQEVQRLEYENMLQQARLDSIAAAEQARVAEQLRRDSLYANFTSPDLNSFQVKGFVKRITMETSCVCAGYTQHITLDFDTLGVLTAATSLLTNSYSNKTLNYKIRRNGDNLKSLSYRRDSEESGLSSEFMFSMEQNHLKTIVVKFCETAGVDWDMVDANVVFGDYNDINLPTTIKYNDDTSGGVGMYHGYSSYSAPILYTTFDNNGNWTVMKISGTMNYKQVEMSTKNIDYQTTRQENLMLTRTINYYSPEEIFHNATSVVSESATAQKVDNAIDGPTSVSIIKEFDNLSEKAYKYKGEIGDNKIEAELKIYGKNAGQVIGKYRYIRNNQPGNWLGLKGTRGGIAGNNILKEYNAAGKCTGTWEFSERSFGGTFTLPNNGKEFDLFLTPIDI